MNKVDELATCLAEWRAAEQALSSLAAAYFERVDADPEAIRQTEEAQAQVERTHALYRVAISRQPTT